MSMARRFSLPPVTEASYEPRQIPNASRDMAGTVLLRPDRQQWLSLLGEMVQMVNEAVRRRASTVRDASKPLSLEYMGDRLDVDDPLTGYLAVTEAEGWMQGFVTCTTFTTWHHGFRWDSTNPVLDLLDHAPEAPAPASAAKQAKPKGSSPPKDAAAVAAAAAAAAKDGDDAEAAAAEAAAAEAAAAWQPRIDDAEGSLSMELQAQLHAGDPDNEGVVWPQIAELALLGALGCGRWLLELLLDELEAEGSPYLYVVTQATEGSIRFYERMGFVRVGAVVARAKKAKEAGGAAAVKAEADEEWKSPSASGGSAKKRKAAAPAPKPVWVASPHTVHVCDGEESVEAAAAAGGAAVADVLFLNAAKHPQLGAASVPRKGSKLLIPLPPDVERARAEAKASHDHVLAEDMTLLEAAAKLGVEAPLLLRLNQARPELRGLQLSSELLSGTRLRTRPGPEVDEYVHWTFPEDDPAMAEPSYMMARRLRPRSERAAAAAGESAGAGAGAGAGEGAGEGAGASRAPGATALASRALMREARPEVVASGKRAAFIRVIEEAKAAQAAKEKAFEASAWHTVAEDATFKKEAASLGVEPRELLALNTARLKGLTLSSLLLKGTLLQIAEPPKDLRPVPQQLVNRVVEIDGEDDYRYWYVLTYLADLQWCHVAPLRENGVFGPKPSQAGHCAEGRPRWMLVSEDEGGEIDVGAGRCHMMEAIEMRGTKANADTEEWDIVGRAAEGWEPPSECGKVKKAKPISLDPSNGPEGTEADLRRCKAAVQQLIKMKQAEIFREPVDHVGLGLTDYLAVISTPMDLGTIAARLDAPAQSDGGATPAGYASAIEVAADLRLVWANAQLYNQEGSWVWKEAEKMKAAAEKRMAPLVAAAQARLDAAATAAAAAEEEEARLDAAPAAAEPPPAADAPADVPAAAAAESERPGSEDEPI